MAARGFEVVGIDVDRCKVESFTKGVAPVLEPRLQGMIDQSGGRLRATTNFGDALERSQSCFFVTPTPSLPDGSFSNEYLLKAMKDVAMGDVVHGLLGPDFVLIGESDMVSGTLLQQLYHRFNTNGAPVERMSLSSAELAKISVNCAVTMKISFTNQLSAICAKIPEAD